MVGAMSNWFRHIALMAQARTGASGSYFVLILLAVLALVAALVAWMVRAHNLKRAKRELEERRRATLVDPGFIPIALQIGQALGWRRLATLAALGVFAAGLAREWFGERKEKTEDAKED